MMDNKHIRRSITLRQINVQRKNLVSACRLAVKSLIDQACFENIEEDSEALDNFFAVMENVLVHRLKPHQTWYGGEEQRWFWDYIRTACRRVSHNSLSSIEALERPKTARGKGRAWLRMALMEKRLSEYISTALQQTKLTRSFYMDGAVLMSEDATVISGVLLGLNAIDFSFDIRAENLDAGILPVIDFTPYLKFEQSTQSVSCDERELNRLSGMAVSLDSNDVFMEEESDPWQLRYEKINGKLHIVMEQKGYLEELVRLRESQLEEVHRQRQKLIETLHHYEAESRRERQQLEGVIIELQEQMTSMKEEHTVEVQQLQTLVRRYSTQPPMVHTPDIALNDLSPANQELDGQGNLDVQQLSGADRAPSPSTTAIVSAHAMQADARSIVSASSCMSIPTRDTDANSNQSMIPLAGSFSSETSFRSSELPLQPLASAGFRSSDRESSSNSRSYQNTPEKLAKDSKPIIVVNLEEGGSQSPGETGECSAMGQKEEQRKETAIENKETTNKTDEMKPAVFECVEAISLEGAEAMDSTESGADLRESETRSETSPASHLAVSSDTNNDEVKGHYSPNATKLLQSAFDSNGGTSTDEGEGM